MLIDKVDNPTKSSYRLLNIDVEGKGKLEAGICKVLEGKRAPHLQLLGDPEIQIEAEKLCRLILDLYFDLEKSSYPALKSLTKYFYDR